MIYSREVVGRDGVAANARNAASQRQLATVLALADALEARGEGSISSAHVVSRYAELIAREMVLSRRSWTESGSEA